MKINSIYKYVILIIINSLFCYSIVAQNPPPISIVNGRLCAGTEITFSYNGTETVRQWEILGTGSIIGSNTGMTVVAKWDLAQGVTSQGVTVTVRLQNNDYKSANYTIYSSVKPSASFTVLPTTICQGSTATFTASSVNGGSSPEYHWYVDGGHKFAGAVYSTNQLTPGYHSVYVTVANYTGCMTDQYAYSPTQTIYVNPFSFTISDPGQKCIDKWGTTVDLSGVVGPGNKTYTWYKNTLQVTPIYGAPQYVYSSVEPINNGDPVICKMTSDACPSAEVWSNQVTVQVTQPQNLDPWISMSPSDLTICKGDRLDFSIRTNSSLSDYYWTYTGSGQPNGTQYTTYDFNNSSVLTFNAIATISGECIVTKTSNLTVTPNMPVSVSEPPSFTIDYPSGTICAGNVVFTASPKNQGSNPIYEWYLDNGVNSVATGLSYNASLSGGEHKVKFKLTPGGTGTYCTNPVEETVTVNITPVPGTITASMPIPGEMCATHWEFSVNATGVSNLQYSWWKNEANLYRTTTIGLFPEDITVINGDRIHCVVSSTLACVSPCTTNVIRAIIKQPEVRTPSASFGVDNINICEGEKLTFSVTPHNGEITYIHWYFSGTGTANGNTCETTDYNNLSTLTVEGAVRNSGTCIISDTEPFKFILANMMLNITVRPKPVATINPSGLVRILSTGTQTINASTGSGYAYQWMNNGQEISGATSNPYVASTDGNYSVTITSNFCSSTSNALTVIKNIKPIANAGTDKNITLPEKSIILSGSGSDADGSVSSYNWAQVTGNSVSLSGINTNTLSVNNLSEGTYSFKLEVTDNSGEKSDPDQVIVTMSAPPNNQNWIKETVIKIKDIRDESEVNGIAINSGNKDVSWSYFDGLGRPMQTVTWQGSPSKNDIVQPIAYDEYGREMIKYLPYTDGSDGYFKRDALGDPLLNTSDPVVKYRSGKQYNFYQTAGDIAHSEFPYSETIFENSPLNRVTEQGAPGETWQPGNNHTQVFDYGSNAQYDVLLMKVDEDGKLINTTGELSGTKRYYGANELYKNIVKNENWTSGLLNTTEEYKDKQGRVVLKRAFVEVNSAITPVETYYVYDDLGLLRYVIPPKAVSSLTFPSDKNTVLIQNLCYNYEYDSRNRMVLKQLPGAGQTSMVYDKRDRLVLTQDAALKAGNINDWLFTKYDEFNRSVVTGRCVFSATRSRDELQSYINGTIYGETSPRSYFVTKDISLTANLGYTDESFPKNDDGAITYYTATYYDDYNFPDRQDFNGTANISGYSDSEGNNTLYFEKLKNMVTGSKTRVLESTEFMTSTNYYDDKYRAIQTIKQNHVGGIDIVSNKYDFVGKIQQGLYTHTGIQDVSIAKRFEYDHAGRLKNIFHKINTGPEILMSYMQYNEVGQLIDKKIHSSDETHVKYLQSIDYRYNIRGWLTHINNANLGNSAVDVTRDDHVNEKPDAFGMELRYNDPF